MIGISYPALQSKLHYLQLLKDCSLALHGFQISEVKPAGWVSQECVFEGHCKMLLWQVEVEGLDVQHMVLSDMLSVGLPAGAGERMW